MTADYRPRAGFLLCCLLVGGSLAAQDGKVAVTRLSEVDEDFHLQGEYFGAVSAPAFDAENMGLQVISRGQGNFEARLLRGGLPAAGWDRQTVTMLAGDKQGRAGSLVGSVYQVSVNPDEALVKTDTGVELARLPKIHRISLTQGAPPPAGAVVLFGGSSTEQLHNAKLTPEGLLDVGAMTKMPVGDFRMHLEFRTPYMPNSKGQGRGNSGIYIQQRYEVQVLDSFGLEGVENECGGLYKQRRPDVNMCLPPLSWQTYDIYFTAARFNSSGKKSANARITVLHNGEPIHDNYDLVAETGAGKPESPEERPILFQNHSDPVRYRNIWIVPARPSVAARREVATFPYCTSHRRRCVTHPIRCSCR
jgi:hypothetical protein